MRIAILSMQRVVNFGSVLQAWSLRELIRKEIDEEVYFLDIEDIPALSSRRKVNEKVDYESPADYPPGVYQKVKRRCIAMLSAYNKRLICKFMEKELALEEKNHPTYFDAVVIGSDEVFNHAKGIRLQLHGQVEQTDKVVAYGASCGSTLPEDIAPEDKPRIAEAMNRFRGMSVRDAATEDYVRELYAGEIYRHLDPVLVGELYKRSHRPVRLKKYLLVYAYGQRIRTQDEISGIREYARSRGLKTVAMGGSQFWCDLYVPAAPFRLLDYFYHADCVVTDTFHGAIFSVINRKRFAVIPRQTNHSKLSSLLEDLGLQAQMLPDISCLETVISREIDYDRVEVILQTERDRTRTYLREQLTGIK